MEETKKTRVLIVDDHPLMRDALSMAIEDESDMEIVGQASNGVEAVDLALRLLPDVIVTDLFMPVKDGLTAIAEILTQNPKARILALTSSTEETVMLSAVQAGVLGYLLKDSQRTVLLQAIREVSQGQSYLPPQLARKLMEGLRQRPKQPDDENRLEQLTGRELDVLRLIGRGASNREVASALSLSEGTVRTHVHHLLNKLGLANRNQAILYALKAGLVDKP